MNFFSYILEQLNTNTYDIQFEGNVFFQYHPHNNDFVIYDINEQELRIEKIEYVPFSENMSDEIPFVDENKRSDFNKMFVVPIKVDNQTSFQEDNEIYKALYEFTQNLNGTSFTYDGFKYAVKIGEPRPEGVPILKRGAGWYRLFSISIAYTRVQSGLFGNEISATLSTIVDDVTITKEVDFINLTPTSAIDTQTERNLSEWSTNKSKPIARQIQVDMTLNIDPDNAFDQLLLDEAFISSTDLTPREYTLEVELPHKTITKNMIIIQATPSFERGLLTTIVLRLVEGG
jgi:hypothetical protein